VVGVGGAALVPGRVVLPQLDGEGVGAAHREPLLVELVVGHALELAARPLDGLLELVGDEQVAVDVAVAVRRPTDHVRRDRRREHLEHEHDEERGDRAQRVLVERDRAEDQQQPEDLRLRRGVHARQGVGEAQEAHAGRQGQQRARQQHDRGGDVVGGVHHEGSCFET